MPGQFEEDKGVSFFASMDTYSAGYRSNMGEDSKEIGTFEAARATMSNDNDCWFYKKP